MKLDVRQLLLGLAFGCIGQGAAALGFGAVPGAVVLGQPVDLRIPLRLEPGEDVAAECVGATVHFGDQQQQRGTTATQLVPALPGSTQRVLRVVTTTRVSEPVVTIEVFAGCGSRITRNFTLFADPPLFEAPATLAAAPAAAPVAVADSAPPAAADRAAPAAAEAAARPPRPRPVKRVRPKPAPAPVAAAPAAAPPVPQVLATVPAPQDAATSRLKLATLEQGAVPTAAGAPAQAVAAAEAAASAASVVADAASARAAELEAAGARLRAEAASKEQTITDLRSRLQQLEGERSQSVLVYGLGGLALLLSALLFWMWRQREQERETSAWLEQAAAANPHPDTPEGQAATAEAVAFAPSSAPAPLAVTGGFDDTQAASRTGGASRPGGLGGPISAPAPLAAERREVSVEELIDLEQQAEFFIVLGQDEAAIDLLMGHLRSTSDASPLPYLKLLEICKRRGDRKEYERLRERFNSRFATHAPEWETDLQSGLTLEDYPAVVGRLQGLWSQPQRAMEVLQATLLRAPSDSDSQADSFDLPAYRELMLLYSVARDLSESGPEDVAVDVLLPIGEPDGSGASPVFERLIATTSLEAQPSVHKPLTVDLPLDDAPAPSEPR